jgi:hypothetical protein
MKFSTHCKLFVFPHISVVIMAILASNYTANAQKNWVGGASGNPNNWNTAANWNPAGIPGTSDAVTIPGSATYYPIVSTAAVNSVRMITVNSGATLTITAGGSVATTVGPASVSVNGTLSMSGGTLIAYQDVQGAGNITMSGGILKCGHDWHLAPANFAVTGGTVEWTGNTGSGGPGAFPGGAGSYRFFNVQIDSGVNPAFDNVAATFLVFGNWVNNGSPTLTHKTTTVQFCGSTTQTITGTASTTFNNLTITNDAGVTLGTSATVNGLLAFNKGIVTTGTNVLILPTTASISGAGSSSYVNGNIQRSFASGVGQSFTFPIGDASAYAPINLGGLNVTVAGSLQASTTHGNHLSIASSGLNPVKSVNRYWTLTNSPSGIALAAGSATFNFVPSDIDTGASWAGFVVRRFNGSWAVPGTAAPTSATVTVTPLSAPGDFATGDIFTTAECTLSSCCVMNNRHAMVNMCGIPSWTYSILASTNLINWTKIGTAATDSNGLCQFEDVNAAGYPRRFYRGCYP